MANDDTKKQVKSTKKNRSTAKEMNELKEKLKEIFFTQKQRQRTKEKDL